jgi:hypothetical protein
MVDRPTKMRVLLRCLAIYAAIEFVRHVGRRAIAAYGGCSINASPTEIFKTQAANYARLDCLAPKRARI